MPVTNSRTKVKFYLGDSSDDDASPSSSPSPSPSPTASSYLVGATAIVEADAFTAQPASVPTKEFTTPPLTPERAALKESLWRWRKLAQLVRAPELLSAPPPITNVRGMTLMSAILQNTKSPTQRGEKEEDYAQLKPPNNLQQTAEHCAKWLEYRFPLKSALPDGNGVLGVDEHTAEDAPQAPPLAAFIEKVLRHSCAPRGSVNRALILADRLPIPGHVVSPTERHRIFLASLVVSCKVAYDWCPRNRDWGRNKEWQKFVKPEMKDDAAPYFTLASINKSEQRLLSRIKFHIDMTPVEYETASKVTSGEIASQGGLITLPTILVTAAA